MRNFLTYQFFGAVLAGFAATAVGAADQPPNKKNDWDLVRSVSNPYGGTEDLVLIPERKKNDLAYYTSVAKEICGTKKTCSVAFWTDRSHIPTSANMLVRDLWEQTARYEVHPNYAEPHLRRACWLFPNKVAGEMEKCFYMPGRKYFDEGKK